MSRPWEIRINIANLIKADDYLIIVVSAYSTVDSAIGVQAFSYDSDETACAPMALSTCIPEEVMRPDQ